MTHDECDLTTFSMVNSPFWSQETPPLHLLPKLRQVQELQKDLEKKRPTRNFDEANDEVNMRNSPYVVFFGEHICKSLGNRQFSFLVNIFANHWWIGRIGVNMGKWLVNIKIIMLPYVKLCQNQGTDCLIVGENCSWGSSKLWATERSNASKFAP